MKKATYPIEAVTFNVKYNDIAAGCKLVRDELKKNISYLKKLGREAEKLYKYGNKKCYIEDDKSGIRPIDGIENIGIKMDDLNWLTVAHDDLQQFIDGLSLFK